MAGARSLTRRLTRWPAWWLVWAAILGAGAVAGAGGPCEEDRGQTGLALAPASAGLAVAAVDGGSAAAASGIRVGDTVLQANGTVARTCVDYARAVHEARRERKALLVLVRRAAADMPLALGAATWERAVAAAPAPAPAEAPSVRALVAAPSPPPLPPGAAVTLAEVTGGFAGLAPAARPPTRLAAYRQDLLRLHRQVETLAARGAVSAEVVAGLRTVLRYYDAAEVAWAAEETQRDRERRPRHVPAAEAAAAPYFADSEAATAIDEFPFLRAAVVRDPGPGLLAGESSGLWRPLQARALLWERGREELTRLTSWLGSAGR